VRAGGLLPGPARRPGLPQEAATTSPQGQSERNRSQRFQDQAVAALEKYIAADPFNATYLRFEYELRPLDGHPQFEQMVARFRDPQATNNDPK
jgi:hypothetical protein